MRATGVGSAGFARECYFIACFSQDIMNLSKCGGIAVAGVAEEFFGLDTQAIG